MIRAATVGGVGATGAGAGVGGAGVGAAEVASSLTSSVDGCASDPCTFCADDGGGELRVEGKTLRFFHSVSKTF